MHYLALLLALFLLGPPAALAQKTGSNKTSAKGAKPPRASAPKSDYASLRARYMANVPDWIHRFENDIRKFEKEDSTIGHPQYDVVFVGSSTFALWEDLPRDFAPAHAVNRGFGGSTIREVIHYANRIVFPYRPKVVVLYVGNDIWGNPADPTPQQVFDNFCLFEQTLHRRMPGTVLNIIGLRPTPRKAKLGVLDKEAQVNAHLRAYCPKRPNTHYIDMDPLAYDEAGNLRMDLLQGDSIHLNEAGNETLLGRVRPIVLKQLEPKAPPTRKKPYPAKTTVE